jgi:predicted cupin superfamily sugar epimerase
VTVNQIKQILHLVPHPEGGSFIQTYKSADTFAPAALGARHTGPRANSTAIYYLLETGTFSELHRLLSDEIFHFYLGDPVEMLQLWPDGTSRSVRLGTNLVSGERPQLVIPRNVWQGSRLVPGGQFALLGCTVSPGFEFADYESGHRNELIRQYPTQQELITALTHR